MIFVKYGGSWAVCPRGRAGQMNMCFVDAETALKWAVQADNKVMQKTMRAEIARQVAKKKRDVRDAVTGSDPQRLSDARIRPNSMGQTLHGNSQ